MTQPKAPTTEHIADYIVDLISKNIELTQENASLKAQLAAKNEPLSNTEQLPVYGADWLSDVINKFDHRYTIRLDSYIVYAMYDSASGVALDPKTSADIILRAVAKELNGGWDGKGNYEIIASYGDVVECDITFKRFGEPKFKPNSGRKAISILNGIDTQILKNYFA